MRLPVSTRIARCTRWLASWIVLQGCGELPEVRYETEHLKIATDLTVCEGTVAAMEDHVLFLEETLGIRVEKPIDVYLYDEVPGGRCPDNVSACAYARPRRIFTTGPAVNHELGHAVAYELGRHDHLFAEGIAEAFEGNRTEFGTQAPNAAVGHLPEFVDDPSAGHFVRWLYDEHGAAKIRDLIRKTSPSRSADHTRSAFHEIYGTSLGDMQTRFFDEAPEGYPALRFCEYESVEWNEGLDFEVELDCDDRGTLGVGALEAIRVFEVEAEAEGWYTVEVDAGTEVEITQCALNTVEFGEMVPRPVSPVGEDPGGNYPISPKRLGKYGVADVFLAAETHRVRIISADVEPTTEFVRIHPRIGLVPP